jgi:hypothetical protein
MPTRLTLAAAALLASAATAQQILHERGPVASIPGGHSTGADLFRAVPDSAAVGLNVNRDFDTHLAQPFDSTAAWRIDRVTVWVYQNRSTLDSTLSGLYLEVWDGPPSSPASSRVAGDLSENVLSETAFSGVYASFRGGDWRTDRPIMALTAEGLDWDLAAGDYWLVWGATGTLAGGPFATYLATSEAPIEGEALQGRFGTWRPAQAGAGVRLAFPLLIEGDVACPADCDASGEIDFFDFLCFQTLYVSGDPGADCDGSGAVELADFACFQSAFAAGCP